MKRVVLFGISMFSIELMHLIKCEMGDMVIDGFTVDKKYIKEKHCSGLPVFPFEELNEHINVEQTAVLLSIGYSQMNHLREKKYHECKERGYIVGTFISKNALVYSENISEGNILMPGCYVGPFCDLGVANVIRSGSILSHHDRIGNFNWIADGCTYGGAISQGDFCFVGLGCTIRNEISIADETFIAAHAYVGSSTNQRGVYMGAPAKRAEHILSVDIIGKV